VALLESCDKKWFKPATCILFYSIPIPLKFTIKCRSTQFRNVIAADRNQLGRNGWKSSERVLD
jgi:hypothetical protein